MFSGDLRTTKSSTPQAGELLAEKDLGIGQDQVDDPQEETQGKIARRGRDPHMALHGDKIKSEAMIQIRKGV